MEDSTLHSVLPAQGHLLSMHKIRSQGRLPASRCMVQVDRARTVTTSIQIQLGAPFVLLQPASTSSVRPTGAAFAKFGNGPALTRKSPSLSFHSCFMLYLYPPAYSVIFISFY